LDTVRYFPIKFAVAGQVKLLDKNPAESELIRLTVDFKIQVCLFCQALVFLCLLFFGVSIYTLIAVSIEQYFAVVHPFSLQKRRFSPMQQGLIRAAIVWIAAAVAAVPIEVFVILEHNSSSHVVQRMYILQTNFTTCAHCKLGRLTLLSAVQAYSARRSAFRRFFNTITV
jgi:hypothetical protein